MLRLLPMDYATRNLGRSRTRTVACVLGSCLVVLLALASGAFVRGIEHSIGRTGDPRNIMIVGTGSEESLERSEIAPSVAGLVGASVPGLRSTLGTPHVSPEVHVQLPVRLSKEASQAPLLMIRGVTATAMLVHQAVQVTSGRIPSPGRDELMVGRLAPTRLGAAPHALAEGSQLWIEDRPWTVVGTFASPGSIMEAELWVPLTDLKAATRRDTDSCVIVTLDTAEPEDLAIFARQRLDLEITTITETQYYAALSAFFAPVRILVWVTAGLISLGGVFGGLNTMYAAFAARTRELGMLRSLGYRRTSVVASLIQESLLASTGGALLACALSLWLLDGRAVEFSIGVFALAIDPPVLLLGMATGATLGLVGALPPAWRSLRLPIPESLKAV